MNEDARRPWLDPLADLPLTLKKRPKRTQKERYPSICVVEKEIRARCNRAPVSATNLKSR